MTPFQPQDGARDLAPHPHRVELHDGLRRITWPELCPNCGAPARERIPVRKVFRRAGRHRGGPVRLLIAGVDVPFCPGCARSHREAETVMTPLERALSQLRTAVVIPLLCSSVAAPFTLKLALDAPPGEGRALGLALFAFFALAWLASLAGVWRVTRHLRVPPQTAVTRAFDFSDTLGSVIVGERRAFTIRNPAFAEAFVAANRHRLWSADDRFRARRAQWATLAVVVALMLGSWLWSLFGAG